MTLIELAEQKAKESGMFPLREAQTRALNAVFSGKDLMLIWPTGSGKSLCYQLPGLVLEGVTVVLSPLIALMDDQVSKARKLGWPVTCIHSGIGREAREARLAQVRRGEIKLLYVTPERFRQEEFCRTLKGVKVSLLAIDEAHCVSQWGHDFRPDYSRIKEIREVLGHPQVMALTATATKRVQEDIWKQAGVDPTQGVLLWEGVERPNLHLSVEICEDIEVKIEATKEWIKAVSGPKIIYFTLISNLAKVAERLESAGIRYSTYHGDLDDSVRRRNLRNFVEVGEGPTDQLMLATPAFGLGVDKPDVRGVLHFEVPASIEAYFQEVGRAGRDGAPSQCQLLYCQDDLAVQMGFIDSLTPEPFYLRAVYKLLVDWKDRLSSLQMDDLREQLSFKNKRDFRLETALNTLARWDVIRWPHRRLNQLEFLRPLTDEDVSEEVWKVRKLELQKKLMAMVELVRGKTCRKVKIYSYLGWENTLPCGACDICDRKAKVNRG